MYQHPEKRLLVASDHEIGPLAILSGLKGGCHFARRSERAGDSGGLWSEREPRF